ncbi:MAG: HAD family hydrolase [Pseudomonadota bacterium]
MQVKGVLFDLGGTLFSYARRGGMGRAIFEAASGLGIDAPPEDIGRAWGSASKSVMAGYAARDYFLHRDLFHDTLSTFAGSFDKPVDADLAERFHAAQRQSVIDHLPLRDDCHETLEALKARGLYLSIVSNIDDDYLDPLVAKHDLHRWLDHWTSSEEAESCKPHHGIYHYSLRKAALGVDDTLFVGDSLHHDVAGASAVGMRSARIVEEGITTPLTAGLEVTAEPDFEITALTDLLDIVDRLNAGAG